MHRDVAGFQQELLADDGLGHLAGGRHDGDVLALHDALQQQAVAVNADESQLRGDADTPLDVVQPAHMQLEARYEFVTGTHLVKDLGLLLEHAVQHLVVVAMVGLLGLVTRRLEVLGGHAHDLATAVVSHERGDVADAAHFHHDHVVRLDAAQELGPQAHGLGLPLLRLGDLLGHGDGGVLDVLGGRPDTHLHILDLLPDPREEAGPCSRHGHLSPGSTGLNVWKTGQILHGFTRQRGGQSRRKLTNFSKIVNRQHAINKKKRRQTWIDLTAYGWITQLNS